MSQLSVIIPTLNEAAALPGLLEALQTQTRGGVTRLASTITSEVPLEFPSRQRLTVVVRQSPLSPGPHRLEITVELLGFGEISAQIRDSLI